MRAGLTAFVVTPAAAGSASGNRVTALRWAKRLRELGWHVIVATEWAGEPCDVLVALHARKSHASIARHAQEQPSTPRVVALTGTDVYGELEHDDLAQHSLALAARIVVLQPMALERLPADLRARTRVIRQAALAPRDAAVLPRFTACVLAHLREVKDPLLAAAAAARLAPGTPLEILHLGGAPDEQWVARAREAEHASRGHWRWLGERPRGEALRVLAGSHLLVLTSRTEGGANVVTEAIAAGVPVLSTRIDGSLGILGDDYPGYFAIGDADELARLLARAVGEPRFLDDLRARVIALRPLVTPERERASWRELLAEIVTTG